MLIHRFGVHIIRRQVIAALHLHTVEIALIPGHAMQRVDVGAYRDDWHHVPLGAYQELRPGAVYRHGLDFPAVGGELATGY